MTTQQPPTEPSPVENETDGSRPAADLAARLFERVQVAWRHPLYGFLLRALVGYVVLVEIAVQLAFGQVPLLGLGPRGASLPRGVFLNGAVIGSLYALIAMGLILVYRANRVINFAQAQLGAVPAVFALLLMTIHGWPYLVVVPIALIGGALMGGVLELGFVRRFQSASRMSLTVITIGIGFLLLVAEVFMKIGMGGDLEHITTFPTPFQGFEFSVGIVRFTGDALVTLLVVGAIVAALAAFFRFTDLGIAVRAAAENAPRASLLGVPVGRVSTIVWILAGVLSAVGIFLRAPLVGLPIAGFVGPTVLIFGLAAAVMARMEHLPTALLAGMFVGIVDQTALFATGRASLASAAVLVVILGALLLQKADFSRAMLTGTSWEMVKNYRPIPAELRGLPEVARARKAMWATVAVLALLAPFMFGTGGASFATLILIFSMVGVSLVVLTGWAGQISLGQFAIAGVGAAIAGGLAANHTTDFFVALVAAGLGGAIIALLVGLPALRIQGLLLAVTTLAFAFAVQDVVLNREYFGWLLPPQHAFVERPWLYGAIPLDEASQFGPITLGGDAKLYYVTLTLLVLVMSGAAAFRRSRSGRLLMGVRDNTRMTEAFGVSSVHTRLVAFAVSGFIAALAGALLAYEQGAVDSGTFTPERSIQVFVMTVIGGIGSLSGAVIGAVFVLGVPLLPGLRQVELVELLSSGLGVLVILYFLPGGLTEGMYRLRDHYLRWVAARHGVHVPSLVADSLVEEPEDDAIVAAAEEAERHEGHEQDATMEGQRP